jgi:hypothetical protein
MVTSKGDNEIHVSDSGVFETFPRIIGFVRLKVPW